MTSFGPRVPSRGPKNAKIMIVGEAPGEKEVLAGAPFVGPAGNTLTELLLKAGIEPDSVYYTNVCKHRPPDNNLSRFFDRHSGMPEGPALEGLMELSEEIEEVNPNVIIPVGNWPLYAFGCHSRWDEKKGVPTGIGNRRGYVFEAQKLAKGRKLVPTYHPSYIQRGAYGEAPLVVFDLRRAKEQSAYPDVRRMARTLLLDPRGLEREAVRDRLLDDTTAPFISFDIEYIGNRLLCCSFTTRSDWAATIRVRSPKDVEWIRAILESGRPLCAQNGISDCSILEWHYGMEVVKHLKHDTMEAAYVLNIEYPKDLGFLACLYTDLRYWKEDVQWGTEKKPVVRDEEWWATMLEYNALDSVATHEIALGQIPELNADPAFKRAFAFDMSKILPLWEISRAGVKIDTDMFELLVETLEREKQAAETKLRALGAGNLNINSGDQVAKFLFDKLGVPSGGLTPTGKRKTDDKTLAAAMIKCKNDTQRQAISILRAGKEASSLKSKFGNLTWDADKRMRCHLDPTKTGTRRLSSREFYPTGTGGNLQNIPVRDPRPRKVFIPDDGHEFAYADLKGAEFEIVAAITQDPEMLRLSSGARAGTLNVHKETAAFLFGVDPKDVSKESPYYYLGKKTRHSGNYMIGPKTFMDNINAEGEDTGVYIDFRESKRILKRYEELHPGLPQWWRSVERELRASRTLSNLFGFKRVFHDRIDSILPVAVAFVPQSTVGDMLNMGLLNCWEDEELRRMGFKMLLQIHDAIGYQYPAELRYEVNSRVRELLDVPVLVPKTGETLHIPVEVNVGPSWGECVEWTDDLKKEKAA